MSNKGITADEARKNSQSSTFGVDEVLKQLETAIQANSKAGLTSITSMFSREALSVKEIDEAISGNDSNLLIVFYVQIMPDDFVMQLHR
ncbi:hypothetical protein NL452_21765, partial [Klebsiella pneumoniae]|nr:hypothetical protein [Klebsiella pneumoniae]